MTTHAIHVSELNVARDSVANGCFLEEIVLPTFAWQRHADLLRRATPPIALRVWAGAFMNGTGAAVVAAVASAVRDSADASAGAGHLSHVFSLKVPHWDHAAVKAAMEGEPPADQLIKQAVSFINNPRVKHTSVEQKRAFLNGKGLSEAQVDEAFRLAAASKAASPPAQPHEASGAAAAPATTTTTTAVAERTSGNV